MMLLTLAALLVKFLPVIAALWGMVAIAAAYEWGMFAPSNARPRPLFRSLVLQIGRVTVGIGVQYAS